MPETVFAWTREEIEAILDGLVRFEAAKVKAAGSRRGGRIKYPIEKTGDNVKEVSANDHIGKILMSGIRIEEAG